MAKKLKDYYGKEGATILGEKIENIYPEFNKKDFINHIIKKVKNLEFLDRQDVYVESFNKYLPKKYEENIKIFRKILGPELKTDIGMFKEGWWLWPVGRYVETNGVKNIDISLKFIYELTKRFTGEFAIRPLLEKNPKKVLKILKKWSEDKNVHVRRLSSESLRSRLPWASHNTVFSDNFDDCFKILDNLKNSSEKFVQKSIGNNINDLFKSDPKLAKRIINSWSKKDKTPETEWIIKHGMRNQK